MKSNLWLTIVLLVFVAAAIATVVYQEFHSNATIPVSQEAVLPIDNAQPQQFIVYYFYGDQRCATCMKLEAYTEEALKTHFQNELDSQLIVWKSINIDQPEHQHFITDFELEAKMVVVADLRNGEVNRWKKLNDIWQLVGDKDAFIQYIQTETGAYLGDES